jgi:uncharacterized surface protein with fasciclin (FAS1) repeats
MKSLILKTLLVSASLFIFTACGDDDEDNPTPTPTLAAVVEGDARFTILLDALQRTGLDATLDAQGTYTVFVPTNEAFNNLFASLQLPDLDALETDLGLEGLENVLLYHVLGSRVTASQLTTGYLTTLSENSNGNGLSIYANVGNDVMLNSKAKIERTNINASNGIAHVISEVILPLSVFQLIAVNPNYSSVESALTLADGNLTTILSNRNASFTIFAPDNEAFDDLVAATPNVENLIELVTALGTAQLSNVLLYHVVAGELRSGDLTIGSLTTSADDGMGGNFSFSVNINSAGDVTIADRSTTTDDATVELVDATGTNGVVHGITAVLLPQ